MDTQLASLMFGLARLVSRRPQGASFTGKTAAAAARRVPLDPPLACWEERIWLDRREDRLMPLPTAGDRSGWIGRWQAVRQFVARMQLGPLAGAGVWIDTYRDDRMPLD